MLSKKKAIKEGYKMWKWLGENPSASKLEYFRINSIKPVHLQCFACEYALKPGGDGYLNCSKCFLLPLWGNNDGSYYLCGVSSVSPYKKWYKANNLNERRRYAKIIAYFHKKLMKELMIK